MSDQLSESVVESATLLLPAPPLVESGLPVLDAGDVVEEAEQLLRETAPHDFDVLVIGSGPGGCAAALRAARLGAHVGLVEAGQLGGANLNHGCLPLKTLLHSARMLHSLRHARDLGINVEGEAKADYGALSAHKQNTIAGLRDEVESLLATNNVEIVHGLARFVSEHTVEVAAPEGVRRIKAVHIVIATGSVAGRPQVQGMELPGVMTPEELLQLESLPKSLVILGAGAIGLEFSYLFHELGVQVTVLEESPAILPGEDAEIVAEMGSLLRDKGFRIETGATIRRIEADAGYPRVVYTVGKSRTEKSIAAQTVLVTNVRTANTTSLELDKVSISHEAGRILVDEFCETSVAGVYAIGDCAHQTGWAHLAVAEGTLVADSIMRQPPTVDLSHIPICYYTWPEIATVGLTEGIAKERGINVASGQSYFRSNYRAASLGERGGWAKVIIEVETEKILGCQIIGPHATELINQAVLALNLGQTVAEFVGPVYSHPSLGETLIEAALDARQNGEDNNRFALDGE